MDTRQPCDIPSLCFNTSCILGPVRSAKICMDFVHLHRLPSIFLASNHRANRRAYILLAKTGAHYASRWVEIGHWRSVGSRSVAKHGGKSLNWIGILKIFCRSHHRSSCNSLDTLTARSGVSASCLSGSCGQRSPGRGTWSVKIGDYTCRGRPLVW